MSKRAIFLVGPMASGKSRVGRALAHRLGWRFIDLDERIARTAGRSIPELFEREGERTFRRRESRCLKSLRLSRVVVATGGGAVIAAGNRAWMKRNGALVRLKVGAAAVRKRLSRAQIAARPLLKSGGMKAWSALAREREKYYAQAEIQVKALAAPKQVAELIILEIQKKKPKVLTDKTLR